MPASFEIELVDFFASEGISPPLHLEQKLIILGHLRRFSNTGRGVSKPVVQQQLYLHALRYLNNNPG